MNNEITSTQEMAEQAWDGISEGDEAVTDMTATKGPENKGMEFHVQMRGYTLNEMNDLIVEAAANFIVGQYNDQRIAKEIQDRCTELITSRIDEKLDTVTAEIIDRPMIPDFPWVKDKSPVTMREYIGLTGREYLDEPVDRDGKRTERRSYSHSTTRIAWLVQRAMDRKFKNEIQNATRAAVAEIQKAVKEQHQNILDAQKSRLADALSKLTE